jgi:hypothetical protein
MAAEGAGKSGLQAGQLLGQAADDRDGGRHHLGVGGRDHRWGLQLLAGQGGLDGGGASVYLASTTGLPQRGHELSMGQHPAQLGAGG